MKKTKVMLTAVVCLIVCFAAVMLVGCDYYDEDAFFENKPMHFNAKADGTFNIMQLTDTHFQTDVFGSGKTIDKIIDAVKSEKPDLVVVSGDVATPSSHDPKGAAQGLKKFAMKMDEVEQYWTMIYGNHDIESAELTSDDFYEILSHYKYAIIADDATTDGKTDYSIDILQGDKIAHTLVLMDTHSNDEVNDYTPVSINQIEWYERILKEKSRDTVDGELVKSTLFAHIPLPIFNTAYDSKKFDSRIEVLDLESRVFSSKIDNGFFDKIVELGSTASINVGHDHNFNWAIEHQGVLLHYARVTGYDAWGRDKKAKPGYTMIKINTNGKNHTELYDLNVKLF